MFTEINSVPVMGSRPNPWWKPSVCWQAPKVLLVDPVYGGKALAGLIAAIRRKEFGKDEAVLFLMTGGTPGLFIYRDSFQTNEA